METLSGGTCGSNSDDGMPSDDCIFVVDGPSSIESSIMAVPYLDGNDQWCDLTEERIHNSEIPTKHNTMCDGQSVFEVVRQSPDFNYYKALNTSVTDPVFTILRPRASTEAFVLTLDYSGSMDTANRLGRMIQGVTRFMNIDIDLEDKIPIGTVGFAQNSQIRHEIVSVDNEKTRQDIINSVQSSKASPRATCINRGVQDSLKALRDYNWMTGGLVVFLTDGQHSGSECNSNDWLGDTIDEVLQQGVRFCTIAFSNSADKNLETLAQR